MSHLTVQRGATLVELMSAATITATLIALAMPELSAAIESRRVAGAAEQVRLFLQFVRSEAITRMTPIVVTYAMNESTNWYVGANENSQCDPSISADAPNACSLSSETGAALLVIQGTQYPNISAIADRPTTTFDPVLGTAGGSNATITFSGRNGKEARVIVSNIGRIRTCSPAGAAHVTNFSTC
ncbi:GspH/FimT family pseudopilin [Azoarcus sp. KH32C]|uniref:GspH/FimT family pseudopilin n=1 Tax=Azoarcus sp. KH32C TaxID=748247 RepID=UPI0009FD6116|nr:GspH/FimT family pseudopilin [Azoarcus sp. KH32C]